MHSCIHAFMHAWMFIHSFIHSFHSFIHSFHSFIHSFISFIHSFIHFISSFIHSLIHSCMWCHWHLNYQCPFIDAPHSLNLSLLPHIINILIIVHCFLIAMSFSQNFLPGAGTIWQVLWCVINPWILWFSSKSCTTLLDWNPQQIMGRVPPINPGYRNHPVVGQCLYISGPLGVANRHNLRSNMAKDNSDNNWLVVDLPIWKMMEWKSVGMIFPFPTEWKVIKAMFQTTNQITYNDY